MKRYLAEAIGTFALVFFGTGAIIVNESFEGIIGNTGIAIAFGLAVMIMIYAFGNISGAHINPAVSIGFAFSGLFQRKEVLPYILSQLAGAFAASFLLSFIFPKNRQLGMTLPSGEAMQSFYLEIILTYFLMLVILFISQSFGEIQKFTGIAVGSTVLLEALFAGPVCGASMNPARSVAPAFVAGDLHFLWIYLLAPVLGAIMATYTWRFFQNAEKPASF